MKRQSGASEKPDELFRIVQDLELLNTVSFALQQSLRIEDTLSTAVDQVLSGLDADGVRLYLIEDENFRLAGFKGITPQTTYPPDDGFIQVIGKTGKAAFYRVLSSNPFKEVEDYRKADIVSLAGVPISGRQGVLGVLEVVYASEKQFSERDRQITAELGSLIGLAIQNGRMYEEAADRARRYVAISRSITVTRQLGTLEEVLHDFARVIVQSFGFERCWLGLLDPDRMHVIGIAGFGPGMRPEDKNQVLPIAEFANHPAVKTIQTQKAVISRKGTPPHSDLYDASIHAFVPILHGDHAIGVVGVFNPADQTIQDEDVRALTSVAEQVSTIIENIRFYEEIKTSEERYRMLFESTGSGLAIVDGSLRFKLVNHAFEDLSGYAQSELLLDMSLDHFFQTRSTEANQTLEKMHHPPQRFETEFVCREGKLRQVHLTTTRIPSSSDVLISVIDMTRERELERRLYKSEELASIGELSAGIAHEIRNPLVSIKNSVSLLKEEPDLSDEGNQLLEVMKEETNHLAAIVDDFLQFARPKKPSFHKEDLNRLLHEAVKRCQEWNGKEIVWEEKYDENLPKVSLDRHQIHQVVTNLLLNGIDAVPEGGRVQIGSRKIKSRKDPSVLITISDNGTGIPERNLSKIFQPFFSTKEKGTGMGLAICRRIIEEHHGEIMVNSKEGDGTSFEVKFLINPKFTEPVKS